MQDDLLVSQIPKQTHLHYLHQALALARLSPPKPTNFRVGCILVSYSENTSSSSTTTTTPTGTIISTGYTLELPGNTHAEQCALTKLSEHPPSSDTTTDLNDPLSPTANVTLYTTLEPCSLRLSGNTPCVQRIIATRQDPASASDNNTALGGIRKVIFGAKEPGTFVQDSQSCQLLTDAGVEWEYIADLEEEILKVAMEGHAATGSNNNDNDKNGKQQRPETRAETARKKEQEKGQTKQVTNLDDISPEERKRQESTPRNPKKRMMEAPPS